MTMKLTKLLFYYALLLSTLLACSDDDDTTEPKILIDDYLVDATSIGTQSVTVLKTLISFSDYAIDPEIFAHDVELFKVQYRTIYKQQEVVASGLIVLPKTTEPVGMLSYQHGTIVEQRDAPSVQSSSSEAALLYSYISSPGFIAVIPDMIGFGTTRDIFHPYYIEEPTAQAVTDMIKAAQELAIESDVEFNGRLLLAGYSQGGYATMAAHKAIEADNIDDVVLVASFPAAGGYELKQMQEYLFGLQEYNQPYYLAYLANSHQLHYDYGNLVTDFFSEPYALRIPGLFDGVNSAGEINAQLTTSIPDLLTSEIRTSIDTEERYQYIVTTLQENSLTDWQPQALMYMYHGDQDKTVPYSNSELTIERLLANGASSDNIQLIRLSGKDHGTGIVPYIEDLAVKIIELK
jgi:pimeloyl-ACP methyl ester carboxylesterase